MDVLLFYLCGFWLYVWLSHYISCPHYLLAFLFFSWIALIWIYQKHCSLSLLYDLSFCCCVWFRSYFHYFHVSCQLFRVRLDLFLRLCHLFQCFFVTFIFLSLYLVFDSLILYSIPLFLISSFSIFETSIFLQMFHLFDIMLKFQIGAVSGCKALTVDSTSFRQFNLVYCCYC